MKQQSVMPISRYEQAMDTKQHNHVHTTTVSSFVLVTQSTARCTGHKKVRVYPEECGQQLGTDPSKNGSSKSLVLKSFSGERTLWDSSLPVSLTVWDTPVLCTPPLPLSQLFCGCLCIILQRMSLHRSLVPETFLSVIWCKSGLLANMGLSKKKVGLISFVHLDGGNSALVIVF